MSPASISHFQKESRNIIDYSFYSLGANDCTGIQYNKPLVYSSVSKQLTPLKHDEIPTLEMYKKVSILDGQKMYE
jgi:hypothetical protein